MMVTQQLDGQLMMHTERSFGSPLQKMDGYHNQTLESGTPFELTFPASDGGPAFVMKRVVSLVAADFKAIR